MKKLSFLLLAAMFAVVFLVRSSPTPVAGSDLPAVSSPWLPAGEQCFATLDVVETLPSSSLPPHEMNVGDYPGWSKVEGWPVMSGDGSALFLFMSEDPEAESWVVFFNKKEGTARLMIGDEFTAPVEWSRGFLELGFDCPSKFQSLFFEFDRRELRWTAFIP